MSGSSACQGGSGRDQLTVTASRTLQIQMQLSRGAFRSGTAQTPLPQHMCTDAAMDTTFVSYSMHAVDAFVTGNKLHAGGQKGTCRENIGQGVSPLG